MATKRKRRSGGRKKKGRNKGYWYRTGRGWGVSEGKRFIPLQDESGARIKEADADFDVLQEAYARYLLDRNRQQASPQKADDVPILETCQLYLDWCKVNNASSTYATRADFLFDFCHGLPPAVRKRDEKKPFAKKEIEALRIHEGYGHLATSKLLPLHVDQWLAAHSGWDGAKRTAIQALKRALNYGVQAGFLSTNPIKGYKAGAANKRMTYLTPEQEEACYQYANPALAMAIRVCLRTGARYGCEFAKVTRKHVYESDRGIEWRFTAKESKTRRPRTIRIRDEAIVRIVRTQMKEFPDGPIFRNTKDRPWTESALGGEFTRLKKRLAKNGIELDDDACMYSTRHTYAKRTLNGYWTGQKTTIETLSALMGNSRQTCWEHYAAWCEAYTDPLWDSA